MYQVVLVDDELLIVEGLKNAIDWMGFHLEIVYTATDPENALDYLKNNPVHLLITDISMPGMSGIELIKKAREYNSLLSILVLSAYNTFDYVRSAMRHGAENYLLKPLNPEELSESVSVIVNHLKERDTLSGIYGSSMLTFRSNFVENWVKNTFSDDEFHIRAGMLGINLQLDNYTVCIISSSDTNIQGMSQLFDLFLSLSVGTFISHFYFETPTRLVCIISSCTQDKDVTYLIQELDSHRPILCFPFFISAGDTVDNYEDVGSSYRNACKYLFLQYSSMTSMRYSENQIPPVILKDIERDYKDLDFNHYYNNMKKLIYHSSDSRKRMDYQLSIVSWGVGQTSLNQTLDSAMIPFLADIVCDGNDVIGITTYIKSFIENALTILDKRREEQRIYYPVVDTVIKAVSDFSNKDISLKTLAARLKIHPSYLGFIFHQQTGYYFNDYLNDERLKYAAELMKTTNLKLMEIVDRVGFSSQPYFNRLFKKKYGVSPTAYRSKNMSITY